MKRIKKVSFLAGKIRIEYHTPGSAGGWDFNSLICSDGPLETFKAAKDALPPFVAGILELQPAWAETFEVRSVTFSYAGESEIMGATITGLKELANSNTPQNVSTPHKPSEPMNEGGDRDVCLSEECVTALKLLQFEAISYLDGNRAAPPQMMLDFDADEDGAGVETRMDDFDREDAEVAASPAPTDGESSDYPDDAPKVKKPRRSKAGADKFGIVAAH